MSKTIIHTCSSTLVRPNGIVRYINAVINIHRSQGHRVIFVTDAKPTQQIDADLVVWEDPVSLYVPDMKDNHVWLQVDSAVSEKIKHAYLKNVYESDLVVAHDLQSYLGLADIVEDGIFIQHESDILNPESRWSYISDEYLEQQKSVISDTTWRIGDVTGKGVFNNTRVVYTPIPFTEVLPIDANKIRGLLYVGDASERKGAREFMAAARELGVRPTVITHEHNDSLFKDADVYSFSLSQQSEMYQLMSQHTVTYISSRNECMPLVVPECLQFMPVVVNADYSWTRFVESMGATLVPGNKIVDTLDTLLRQKYKPHDRRVLETWAWNARHIWKNFVG